eukprot:361792-Chlamydomonas_euryale.AAC.3
MTFGRNMRACWPRCTRDGVRLRGCCHVFSLLFVRRGGARDDGKGWRVPCVKFWHPELISYAGYCLLSPSHVLGQGMSSFRHTFSLISIYRHTRDLSVPAPSFVVRRWEVTAPGCCFQRGRLGGPDRNQPGSRCGRACASFRVWSLLTVALRLQWQHNCGAAASRSRRAAAPPGSLFFLHSNRASAATAGGIEQRLPKRPLASAAIDTAASAALGAETGRLLFLAPAHSCSAAPAPAASAGGSNGKGDGASVRHRRGKAAAGRFSYAAPRGCDRGRSDRRSAASAGKLQGVPAATGLPAAGLSRRLVAPHAVVGVRAARPVRAHQLLEPLPSWRGTGSARVR